jgi:AraC-like DNA-binding protein
MRRAKALLSQGGMPVYRVADRVGYRSKAEFTKAFKRYSGQTPTDYMRALREGGVAVEAHPNGNSASLNGNAS